MLKAYKYRIYPNNEQKLFFAKTFGCVRFVYNKMLADRIDSYKESHEKRKAPITETKQESRLQNFMRKLPIKETISFTKQVIISQTKTKLL
nr:helix-turn-helix domain-containing protein [Paenibacillus popilliae]